MGWSERPTRRARTALLWTKSNARVHRRERARSPGRSTRSTGASGGSDESELDVLGDVAGLDVVELGCGTAYFSAWLAKLGARPVGVDITPAQLADGAADAGGDRHRVPARRGRRGGDRPARRERSTSPSRSTARRSGSTRTAGSPRRRGCCGPAAGSSSCATRRSSSSARPDEGAGRRAARASAVRDAPLRVAGRRASSSTSAHGEWIDLLRANGFEVERLIELQAPADARDAHVLRLT